MTFENDEARRNYFLNKLRAHLKNPEFRKIEGFPIGEDEDILRLSDPPYYTACPNPFLADFIQHYGKPYDPNVPYSKEPFAADVSEGKYDPLYKVHAYPTKVPYRAIMRYLLHYTNPGDIVLDGFGGTGMTGVAALMCAQLSEVHTLPSVASNSEVGERYAVLCDLSTNATHIAATYTRNVNPRRLRHYFDEYLGKVKSKLDWVYETTDPRTKQKSTIEYTVWSEVFLCENCSREFSYWEAAVSYQPGQALGEVGDYARCPHCDSESTRRNATYATETVFDPLVGKAVLRKKHRPVLINFSGGTRRGEKYPDDLDMDILKRIENLSFESPVSTAPLMHTGEKWGDLEREYHLGISHSHHFFTARNLRVVSELFAGLKSIPRPYSDTIAFMLTAAFNRITTLVRYMPQYKERNVGPLSGTLYKPMLFGELNVFSVLETKAARTIEGLSTLPASKCCFISTQSSSGMSKSLPENSIDYIFTDPPFGDNLPYSELNFNEESWIGVFTNIDAEAIVSETRAVDESQYKERMRKCFEANFQILKPGRWMTIVFHNSRNTIWTAIQEAIGQAGFVVADVRTLDKKRGTTKQQVYTAGAVKQDLVISAYKPNGGLEARFRLEAGTAEGVWDFVRTHLKQLPIFDAKDGLATVIAERQNYLLFDRMVAFHVQRGVTVPLSAAEFYVGLGQRFAERDGMFFLPEQIAEYDRKRLAVKELGQLELIPRDEDSAIKWLQQQLRTKPQTFQELQPNFMRSVAGWAKHERALELSEMLTHNFIRYDGQGEVPSQIHSYLSTNFKELRNLPKDSATLRAKAKDRWYVPDPNKAGDIEKLRERALLKEFAEYCESSQKKLKVFRLEAVRAGFRKAWQERDYDTIIAVANKIPDVVLQEDPKLLMWYDQALTRKGG
ncbi:MAG: site-specific DNA-methyltransferase [Burkholderiaceae bacterium]|nr:site-specific DNA-methyltransferase [Burkholderiaceae bacterium]